MGASTRKYTGDISLKKNDIDEVLSLKLSGSSSGYSILQAPATGSNLTLTLPGTTGSAGYVLKTNGAGTLDWVNVATIAIPGGSDTNIQYNSGGAFAGSNNFTYNGSVVYLNGYLGIQASPTALLHIGPNSGSPLIPALKMTSGTLIPSPQAGAIEYNGSDLYVTTNNLTRHEVAFIDDVYSSTVATTTTIYINQPTDIVPGNDVTGDGTAIKPYATILKALTTIPNINVGAVVLQFGAGSWNITDAECIELSKKKFYMNASNTNAALHLKGYTPTLVETVTLTQGSNPYIYNVSGGTTPWTTNVYEGYFLKSGSVYYPIEGNTSNTVTVAQPSTPSMTQIYQLSTTINLLAPLREFAPIAVNSLYTLGLWYLNLTQNIASVGFISTLYGSIKTDYYLMSCNVQHTGNSVFMQFGQGTYVPMYYNFFKTSTNATILSPSSSQVFSFSNVFKHATAGATFYNSNGGVAILQNNIVSNINVGIQIAAWCGISSNSLYLKNSTNVIKFTTTQAIGCSININALYLDNNSKVFYAQPTAMAGANILISSISSATSYTLFDPTSAIINKFSSPNLGINLSFPSTYPEIENDKTQSLTYNAVTNIAVAYKTYNRALIIKYTLSRGTNYQQGIISILHAGAASPLITEDYQSTADLGVIFDAAYDGTDPNQINLVCTVNNQEANNATLSYNVERSMY